MLESLSAVLARADLAQVPDEVVARGLRVLERADAVQAAVRGRLLAVFDARDLHLADGQRSTRSWLVHSLGVTRGQAAEHKAVQALATDHGPLLAGLAGGHVRTTSVALQLAKWTRPIPAEFRAQAEEIVVAAARAGAGLRELAAICAEIRYRTAPPDPQDENGTHLDRGLSLDTTIDGAGVVRGDLTPECAAMVTAVLDALSAPQGGGDLRTRPERYHDALAEAMRRLLASNLLPRRAGQPVKALVHIYFAELREMDAGLGAAGQVDHRVPGPVGRPPGRRLGRPRRRRRLAGRGRRPRHRLRRDDRPRGHRRPRPERGRGPDRRVRPVSPRPRRGGRRSRGAAAGTIAPAGPASRGGGAGRGHRAERRSRPR